MNRNTRPNKDETGLSKMSNLMSYPYDKVLKFINKYKETNYAPYLLSGPYLLYVLVFFVVPMLYMLLVSFYTNVPTGTMEPTLTTENYVNFLTTPVYHEVLYLTIEISFVVTLFTIIISYPVAYFIAFSDWRYTKALILLVIAPMLVGNVVRAFGWYALMGSSGVFNRFLSTFGIDYTLLNSKPGLIIAIASVLMPFTVLILLSILYTIDEELLEASRNLGGNRIQTFLYVTLPLSLPGVIVSSIIAFVLSMGTFATAVFISMPNIPMLAPFIYNAANQINWPLASAMGFVLLSVSLILVYVYTRIGDLGGSVGRNPTGTSTDVSGRTFRAASFLNKIGTDFKIGGTSLTNVLYSSTLVVLFLYLLLPVLFAIQISFNPSDLYTFPPESLTLKWYLSVLTKGVWLSSFITSFSYSAISTGIAIFLSAPTAYAINRYNFKFRDALNAATFLPLMVPQIIIGLAMLILLNEIGLVGNLLGMSIAVGIIAIPYATQAILATMHNFDRSLEEAALDLGADEIQTFVRITFPALLPGLLTAAILTFVVAYANLQITVFLQGAGLIPVPVRIFAQMQFGASPEIAAIATINIVIVLLAIIIVERLFGAADALGYTR